MNRLKLAVFLVTLGAWTAGFVMGQYVTTHKSITTLTPDRTLLSRVPFTPGMCVQATYAYERWESPWPILRLLEEGQKQWRIERWYDDHWDTTVLSVYKHNAGDYRVVECPVAVHVQGKHQQQNMNNSAVSLPFPPVAGGIRIEIEKEKR